MRCFVDVIRKLWAAQKLYTEEVFFKILISRYFHGEKSVRTEVKIGSVFLSNS